MSMNTQYPEEAHRDQVGVVIVTHNSERTLLQTLTSVARQGSCVRQIVVVDSGSTDMSWSKGAGQVDPRIQILPQGRNVGFAAANNEGIRALAAVAPRYVAFVNPDIIMPDGLLDRLCELMDSTFLDRCAAISPTLWGWDFDRGCPTGAVDSAGIYQKWYGRWYDLRTAPVCAGPKEVPALCGALMFCRSVALAEAGASRRWVWNEDYGTYKEDIELSLLLRQLGWRLRSAPAETAYHGRGWRSRKSVSRWAKLISARNEIRLHAKYARRHLPYSLVKYLAVRVAGV